MSSKREMPGGGGEGTYYDILKLIVSQTLAQGKYMLCYVTLRLRRMLCGSLLQWLNS